MDMRIQLDNNSPLQRRKNGCTECRRKKVKCDLHLPVCSRCRRFPKQCKYESKFVFVQNPQPLESQSQPMERNVPQKVVKNINRPISPSRLHSGHQASLTQQQQQQQHSVASPYLANKHSLLALRELIAKTATTVFPLASRSFVDRLMSSAMGAPPLLYALLACFGSHNARRMTSSSESEKTTLMFTNNAISGLRAALAHDSASRTFKTETLMTAMALCTNDVCNGNLDVFRMHLKAIREMLLSFISSLPATASNEEATEDSILNVYLMKWFAALDVSASLSLFTPHQNQQSDQQQQEFDYHNYWSRYKVLNPSEDVVDDICGYSLNLVPIFSQIGNLARAQYESPSEHKEPNMPRHTDLMNQAQLLEKRLETLPSPKISTRGIWTSQQHQLVEELRDTHPAFVHTALLHLHRRVQLLPKSDPKVRNDVTNILRVVKNVRPFSPANVLLIWPLFSAGCETDSLDERAVIDERMSIMQSLGMGNFTRGREALNKFWESGTSLRWDVYLSQSGIDLVLF